MIHDHLNDAKIYQASHPGLAAAFAFLRRPDLASLPDGRVEIDADRLYAIIARAQGRGRELSPLETHDRYLDVQYIIAGIDQIGWQRRAAAGQSHGYNNEKDLELWSGQPAHYLEVRPGELVVLFPQDAHAPLAGHGPVHKVVVKVAVDWVEAS